MAVLTLLIGIALGAWLMHAYSRRRALLAVRTADSGAILPVAIGEDQAYGEIYGSRSDAVTVLGS